MQLADQVRDALVGVAPAVVHNPRTKYRLVHKRAPPQGLRQSIVVGGKFIDFEAWYESNAALRNRDNGVIHVTEHRDVQIAKITRDQEGHDLSGPVGQLFIASRPTVDDQVDLFRPIAFVNDVLLGRNRSCVMAKRGKRGLPILA